MAWLGMTLLDMVWRGIAWHGIDGVSMTLLDMVWRGIAWHGMDGVAWLGFSLHDVAWHGWHG
jgi:hypothetical protein